MTPKEVDRTIEALPDDEYGRLIDTACSHLTSRAESHALSLAVVPLYFLFCFATFRLVPTFWPGSIFAATIATLALVGALFLMIKARLSSQVNDWLIRRAMRRQFNRDETQGAP